MPIQSADNPLPPFETRELREKLSEFLNQKILDPITNREIAIGNYKFGVYAFFDYDGEPIYVGQTNEKLRTRIRRHLTNQRTDAVAMNVLDPFEVYPESVSSSPVPRVSPF
ncbi:MAG: GIY-YIG nuclease family protein [Trichloromonas sp.]|nr:GIY-YIG nuclease family protein [Trichloromonas sp.]